MNRAMLRRMVMHAGAGRLPPGTALIAVAEDLAAASAALAAGADLIDLGAAPAEMIAAFRADHPGILVCAAGGPADVGPDAAVARAAGALFVCADAQAAGASGLPADRILVEALPAQLPSLSAAGLAAIVDADRAADLAARSGLSHRETTGGLAQQAGPAPGTAGPVGPAQDAADGESSAVAGVVAIAALSSWLGARAVRTRHPVQVRRALDMTASIRGIRAPARAIRGLA